MEKRFTVTFLLAAALLLGLGSAAAAQEFQQESTAGADERAATDGRYEPVKVLGMQVFIDPETGQMRPPTPEEAAELSAALQRMFAAQAPAAPVQHENGMVSLETDFSMMDFSVVRFDSDGNRQTDCVDGLEQATAFIEAATAAAQPEEE